MRVKSGLSSSRTKEAQQRNTRMGKTSGGDRQNLGGLVKGIHVLANQHGKRASIAVPKGTDGRGIG